MRNLAGKTKMISFFHLKSNELNRLQMYISARSFSAENNKILRMRWHSLGGLRYMLVARDINGTLRERCNIW